MRTAIGKQIAAKQRPGGMLHNQARFPTLRQMRRSREGPAHSQAVSITERLRANSGRLRVNVGFRERGGRYSTLRPD